MRIFVCKECRKDCQSLCGDENHGTNLCPDCFEGALEDFEEKRRERIARQNEY